VPVSPREPSLMHGLGAPVVMGPMNGGMDYPPAFASREGRHRAVGFLMGAGRKASWLMHRLMPGKLRAATLLVANERTRRALPGGARGRVVELVENGVDLAVWSAPETRDPAGADARPARFSFVGRLVDWKAVDLLIEAFARVVATTPATLQILGDGPMRAGLEAQARAAGLGDAVRFAGWMPQAECSRELRESDALVLPSLYECGGAVVLEAMACGLPVIATNWGGPADYLDPSCGILVDPVSRDGFVAGLADAMTRLALAPDLRARMGRAAAEKVRSGVFNWDHKIDRILQIYGETIGRATEAAPAALAPASADGVPG
jgi:glycosyltransferase involved in cell wall biosynthesis